MSTFVKNSRAAFDYELLDRFEAGLILRGFEVKAVKTGRASIVGAHVIIRGGEAYLMGATIQPYQPGNTPPDYEAGRTIKLLLSKKELAELVGNQSTKRLTIIPLSLYNKSGKIKLQLALARGKKKYDKRESIKKREAKRQIDRTLKNKF